MNIRIVSASMVMAAALLCTTTTSFASPLASHIPMNAKVGKVKTVSLSLRNDGAAPIKVKAGANEMTINPGQTSEAKLAIGDQIVAEEGSKDNAAGTVIAVIAEQLSHSTIVLR
jgi:hypothetical protein